MKHGIYKATNFKNKNQVGLDLSKTSPVSPERQQMTDAY